MIFRPILSGLDNIRLLVQNGYTVLRVELEAGAETTFAEYNSFYIAEEEDKYRIHVSGYSGTAGYSLCIKRYTLKLNSEREQTYHNINNEIREIASKKIVARYI